MIMNRKIGKIGTYWALWLVIGAASTEAVQFNAGLAFLAAVLVIFSVATVSYYRSQSLNSEKTRLEIENLKLDIESSKIEIELGKKELGVQ